MATTNTTTISPYKPGDLYKTTTTMLCDELQPNKLMVGSVVMIIGPVHDDKTKTITLYQDRIIVFSNISLYAYAKKING